MDLALKIAYLVAYLVLSYLVGRGARIYRRSLSVWFVLSLIFTPAVAGFFLMIADVPHRAVLRDEIMKRVRERHPNESEARIQEIVARELLCPSCNSRINVITGEGLRTSRDRPWALICRSCDTQLPESFAG